MSYSYNQTLCNLYGLLLPLGIMHLSLLHVLSEKAMATHSSTLAWQIPWTEELVGCSPWGRAESDMTEAT